MIYFLIQLPYDHDHDRPSTICSLDEENNGSLNLPIFCCTAHFKRICATVLPTDLAMSPTFLSEVNYK
jgi:hypothetical protein